MKHAPAYEALSIHAPTQFAPSQWEVGALPKPLYIRYRFGRLTVHIDHGDDLSEPLLEVEHGDEFDSEMGQHTMMDLTKELIDWSLLR